MKDKEREEFADGVDSIDLFGDNRTRMVTVIDPCIRYSYQTFNGFILEDFDNRVFVTQVLDAFYSRADNAIDMRIAYSNGQRLIVIQTDTLEPVTPPPYPYETYTVYKIDPNTHHAVPFNLFRIRGIPTNEIEWDVYVGSDDRLANRWKSPEIDRMGKFSKRFVTHTMPGTKLLTQTYTWNGRYYSRK